MKIIVALLSAVVLLAGCSGSADEPEAAATSKSLDRESLTQQAEARVVAIRVRDGKVSPQGDRVEVKVGQQVTLTVTSDVEEEIHVHSDPEHTYQVEAGGSISETFTIDRPGQVAVEAHHAGVTIVQLVVRP